MGARALHGWLTLSEPPFPHLSHERETIRGIRFIHAANQWKHLGCDGPSLGISHSALNEGLPLSLRIRWEWSPEPLVQMSLRGQQTSR